jgi:Ni/Co efflux regulator RcnB
MKRTTLLPSTILSLALLAALVPCSVLADKPMSPHGEKLHKHKQHKESELRDSRKKNHDSKAEHGEEHGVRVHFGDRERSIIRDYIDKEFRRGNCPPGLAKKHNGCLPPGQAKKWEKGRPLPDDVVSYGLPERIIELLGGPPRGHRYARVDDDVLLLSLGTGLVVDAIENY